MKYDVKARVSHPMMFIEVNKYMTKLLLCGQWVHQNNLLFRSQTENKLELKVKINII